LYIEREKRSKEHMNLPSPEFKFIYPILMYFDNVSRSPSGFSKEAKSAREHAAALSQILVEIEKPKEEQFSS
jgi:hypothetical protein